MPSLEFKSYSVNITLVYLDTTDFSAIDAALSAKLSAAPQGFFTATAMVADLSRLSAETALDLAALQQLFKQHQLLLVGVSGTEMEDEHIAAQGLAKFEINDIRQAKRNPPPKVETIAPAAETHSAPSAVPAAIAAGAANAPQNKTFRGNVRSGQRIYAQGGDLTIIGTVGAGAEVIADGNVYVLGSLRGRAFAGAQGNDETHIFASEFSAELVSIAGNYQNYEQLDPYHGGKNCLVTLNKDETMLIVSL